MEIENVNFVDDKDIQKRKRKTISYRAQAELYKNKLDEFQDLLAALMDISENIVKPGDTDYKMFMYLKKQAVRLCASLSVAENDDDDD